MLNFAVGPVMSSAEVCAVGGEQVPYFRTDEFSAITKDNERMLCDLAHAPAGSRAVFLTCSGTGAMEAVIMNTLSADDHALVIDGGSFGHRFRQMLELHGIPHDAVEVERGHGITAADLEPFEDAGITAFLVNLGETSTGVLYDLDTIAAFCKRTGAFLIVDGISSFLTDELDMAASGTAVMITDSQKALAVAPGIAPVVLAPAALERIERAEPGCMYFDLKDALKNGERGQTPFTPAVNTLRQLHVRVSQIEADGGAEAEIARVHAQAQDFRDRIADLPFTLFSQAPQNAVTSLSVAPGVNAHDIFVELKDHYDIWVCPNGGDMATKVFRVGHMGALTSADNETLVAALRELQKKGMLG
ncbi:MAG: aminotransferase class V-fold PLP-dependent enzyme [Eggerthellaceae bacterium]|jgi:aspartate aminotransferase-like enzyme